MERSRRRLILETDFEESRVVALLFLGITCIRIVVILISVELREM